MGRLAITSPEDARAHRGIKELIAKANAQPASSELIAPRDVSVSTEVIVITLMGNAIAKKVIRATTASSTARRVCLAEDAPKNAIAPIHSHVTRKKESATAHLAGPGTLVDKLARPGFTEKIAPNGVTVRMGQFVIL